MARRLVMVHGSTVDRLRWGGIVSTLAKHFCLHLVDRRGRGDSGDGPVYSIEREFEDVVAVLESTEVPAHLLGHSYGALCALEALRLTARVAKVVLYEPPLPLPGQELFCPTDLAQRLESLLAAGDRAGVVETFMREVIHSSDREIEGMRHTSTWDVRFQPPTPFHAKSGSLPPTSFAQKVSPTCVCQRFFSSAAAALRTCMPQP
jgi:pimeloyl-ACP methyl ester carboxylesterase